MILYLRVVGLPFPERAIQRGANRFQTKTWFFQEERRYAFALSQQRAEQMERIHCFRVTPASLEPSVRKHRIDSWRNLRRLAGAGAVVPAENECELIEHLILVEGKRFKQSSGRAIARYEGGEEIVRGYKCVSTPTGEICRCDEDSLHRWAECFDRRDPSWLMRLVRSVIEIGVLVQVGLRVARLRHREYLIHPW